MTSVLHSQFATAAHRRATTASPPRHRRPKLVLRKRRKTAVAAVAQRLRFRASSTEEKTFATAATAAPLLLATTTPQRGLEETFMARGVTKKGPAVAAVAVENRFSRCWGALSGFYQVRMTTTGTSLLLTPARSDTPRHTLLVRYRRTGSFRACGYGHRRRRDSFPSRHRLVPYYRGAAGHWLGQFVFLCVRCGSLSQRVSLASRLRKWAGSFHDGAVCRRCFSSLNRKVLNHA